MEFRRKRKSQHRIDMAPLVDVVFLLLLFFMLTAHMIMEPAIKIHLPPSKTAAGQADSGVVISISRQGRVYVDAQPVDLGDLTARVRHELRGKVQTSVTIKADRAAPVGLLVQVVDGVRLAGNTNFNIVTERR